MIFITAEEAYAVAAKKNDEQSDVELHFITLKIKEKAYRGELTYTVQCSAGCSKWIAKRLRDLGFKVEIRGGGYITISWEE